MDITRRGFLKMSGMTLGLMLCPVFLKDAKAKQYAWSLKTKTGTETTTICPYCACGCGIVVTASGGKVVNTEGDPDHPINQGALCSKGSSLYQTANNSLRNQKVLWRRAGASEWKELPWGLALFMIARRIKKTRRASFVATQDGVTVNRCEGIAALGGAALDNEECYLYSKLMRSLGIVYLEHQARVCHSATVPALAESFGRGAMTNHWIDVKNSDYIMIMGSNAAENHPMSFKWVTKAIENGAKLISVDPRFTRTSSKAHLFAQIRPGTDIAFINGMINLCIQNKWYNEEYVKIHTNALTKINAEFSFDEATGLFSGYDPVKHTYKKDTWQYQLDSSNNNVKTDSLDDPNCVFQLLARHVSRYTPEKVSAITGVSVERFLEVAETYCKSGARDKVGTILYAMGWTHHSVGVQNIRAFAILQLLLGNIGLAGGGVNALRGESNVQGSTDHALLAHILPGYLPVPTVASTTLDAYVATQVKTTINPGKSTNYWQNTRKFAVSLLKDYFGEYATAENEFAYNYLPKAAGNANELYSHIPLFQAVDSGIIKGMIAMGQNPAVSGPDAEFERNALGKLDWLVVADLWETETAAFWKRDGVNPRDIKTEVFLLPAAASFEKEGSITNSGRWMQWRYKAVEPVGVAKSDLWILGKLGEMVKKLHKFSLLEQDKPIQHLDWNYGIGEDGGPDVNEVAKRINGRFLADVEIDGKVYAAGTQVPSFALLRDDGTTSSGSWIYCGSYTESGNQSKNRDLDNSKDVSGIGLYSKFAWCWPVNRRIIYNRASCDANGNPWNENKKVIWWDGSAWQGGDVRDFGTSDPKDGVGAFIMQPEGLARLFGMGRVDGPFPEHYEPFETPLYSNPLGHSQLSNPVLTTWHDPGNYEKFPYVCTTYRLVEHWQAGAMTRNLPWLAELVPDVFVEISETLADKLGVVSGDKVRVFNTRGSIEAFVLKTNRIKKLTIAGQEVEVVGLPWHFGYQGIVTGGSANSLTPRVGDPNTQIPEFKAFLVNIEPL